MEKGGSALIRRSTASLPADSPEVSCLRGSWGGTGGTGDAGNVHVAGLRAVAAGGGSCRALVFHLSGLSRPGGLSRHLHLPSSACPSRCGLRYTKYSLVCAARASSCLARSSSYTAPCSSCPAVACSCPTRASSCPESALPCPARASSWTGVPLFAQRAQLPASTCIFARSGGLCRIFRE